MKNSLKNHNGFALVITLSLMPVLVAGMLVVLFALNYMQMNARHLYLCRTAHIKTQNQVAPLLSQLLKLNAEAKFLRQQRKVAEQMYAAAIQLGGYGVAAAKAYEMMVIAKQTALGVQQRQLISNSDRWLSQGHSTMQRRLSEVIQEDLNSLKPFIKSSFNMKFNSAPRLAVRPDKPDIAPIYSTFPDIEERQALAHHWQYSLQVANFLEGFLQGKQTFEKECAVTLSDKGNQWSAKIHRVKSWSKSVW